MKTFPFGLGLSLTSICINPSFGQGLINFANLAPGVNAPVTDSDGSRISGPGFMADLYWAPGVVLDSTVLAALGLPAAFNTYGYFLGGARTIPGQGMGNTITAQVRVWDLAHGSSWGQAWGSPGSLTAESALFQVTLTTLPYPPASMTGLRPFSQDICLSCSQPWPVAVAVHANGPGGVLFSWPAYINAGRYRVQQNPDLNPSHWVTLPDLPVLVAQPPFTPEFQVTLTNSFGNMFYRLVWQ